jgi:enamine deaminase RidA (YjgF/YER057c/UK114 family)
MKRENILTGSPWEDKMGYCRAVRIANIIEVSGTVAIIDGEKVKADDAYSQTFNILERVEKVLEFLPQTSLLLRLLLRRMLLFLRI